jgi:hypothetical protein
VVVTNVSGPQLSLYLLGRRMPAIYPLVPLAANTALGTAVISYNGALNFGLSADHDALADLELPADDLRDAIDALVNAGVATAPVRA